MERTSLALTGSSRSATSCSTSTHTPPQAERQHRPPLRVLRHTHEQLDPRSRIGETRTPSTDAAGACVRAASRTWRNARRTAASPTRLSATPPMSLLWPISAARQSSAPPARRGPLPRPPLHLRSAPTPPASPARHGARDARAQPARSVAAPLCTASTGSRARRSARCMPDHHIAPARPVMARSRPQARYGRPVRAMMSWLSAFTRALV